MLHGARAAVAAHNLRSIVGLAGCRLAIRRRLSVSGTIDQRAAGLAVGPDVVIVPRVVDPMVLG
jgi:hypothetical protein